jgi:hypothetical protein
MMSAMTSRRPSFLVLLVLSMAMIAATATDARAQDEDEQVVDARLQGYPVKVDVQGTTALTWLLLVTLGIVTLGVLFKDSRRSHLD